MTEHPYNHPWTCSEGTSIELLLHKDVGTWKGSINSIACSYERFKINWFGLA